MTNTNKKNKNTRKLLGAIGMLSVSAAMLVSSTFAWFSMNKKVTANSASLKATVPQQLLIKGSASGAIYKSDILFTNSADSAQSTSSALIDLYPVAYKSRSAATSDPNNTFKKLITTQMKRVDVDGKVDGAAADLTDTNTYTAATANTDYFYDNFTVKYAGELDANNAGLTVTITVEDSDTTNTASPIVGALHVVLVDNKATPNVYEFDLSNATESNGVYTIAATNLTTFTANNEEIKYNVYLFYDGEDADCKNSNAVNMDNYTFNFEFNIAATPATGG